MMQIDNLICRSVNVYLLTAVRIVVEMTSSL